MSIRCDGSADALSRTTNLPTVTAFTMMAWGKVSVNRNSYSSFLWYGIPTFTGGTAKYVYQTDNSGLSLVTWNGIGEVAGSAVTLGAWNHFAMTVSGTSGNNFLAYLNGALNITNEARSIAATSMSFSDASTHGFDNEWLNGCLAAIKVWSAVLTAAEIAQEMRYYRPVRGANLNTWAPCIHPTAASNGQDFSGIGGNLTVGGTLAVEDGPPIAWAPRPRMPRAAPFVAPPAGGSLVNYSVHRMHPLMIR